MARRLVLIVGAAALIVAAWLELEDAPEGFAELGKVIGLALAPTLVLLATRRRLAALAVLALATLTASSAAFDVPLTDMRPYSDRDFFGPIFAATADGFRDMYEARTPFDRLDHPELAGLVLLAVFTFLAVAALLVAARRPLSAGLVLLVGVGFPATVAAAATGSAPLPMGALVLAALLVLLFLTREGERPLRGLGPALGLGVAIVLVAVGASSSGAVAKDAFVGWQRWDFYDRPDDPVAVRYVWSSNYRGISFPKKATVVLRIKAPHRAVYWRATALDEFTGVGWRESATPRPTASSAEVATALSDPLLPDVARKQENWTRQDVTVVALSDSHLIGAAEPVKWRVEEGTLLQYAPGGVVFQPTGLVPGQRYTVWSYTAQVEPKELAKLPARYPDELGPFLEVVPDVRVPAFGVKGRNRLVEAIFADRSYDTLLAEYEPLYRKAREIVGDTPSPYLAAASLETWFRSSGEFRYDEQPSPVPGEAPPLVKFVLQGKEGYCQHYAGAMAVMLRLLGIPARVGAGFTSGGYDDARGEWVVTDHNAHTWVEVWFPRYGWLTFNPTPGRGAIAASYSTSSFSFPQGGPNALGVAPALLSEALRERLAGVDPRGSGTQPDSGAGAGSVASRRGGLGIAGLVFIVIAAGLALVLMLKSLRRRLRFIGRDPRQAATACRRDLVAFLADQRIEVPPSATLGDIGAIVERRFRVVTLPFVRAATAARFGPSATAGDAARRARRELRTLERELRRQISVTGRTRGAFSLRSLTV